MSKVYARTNTVPYGCDYITPGKAYLVTRYYRGGVAFEIIDDVGDWIVCCWNECPHLDELYGWERVELPEEAPPSRYQLLTIEELEADLSAIECALQAKRAEETAAMIDG
jgi:hypothetical protein